MLTFHHRISFVAAILVVIASSASLTGAEPLRYRWQTNQKFGYEITVTSPQAEKTETYHGHALYSVKSIDGDSVTLQFQGGLQGTSQKKGATEISRSTTYSSESFSGLKLTSSELVVSPLGQVVTLKNENQLPFMLGNLALLVFEVVPDVFQPEWTMHGGVGITSKKQSNDRFGPGFGPGFGPRSFFGSGNGSENEKTSAATTTEQFRLKKDADGKVIFDKTFALKSPGDQSINIAGEGTWTFDRNEGLSDAMKFSQRIDVTKGNTTTNLPVTIAYRRLSSQERDKIEFDRAEEARLKKEANDKFWADKKKSEDDARKIAETPLTAEETAAALAALKAGANSDGVLPTLEKLSQKRLKEPDPTIVEAIRAHLKHPDTKTRRAAEDAMAAWNADYKKSYDVFVKYRGRHRTWDGSGRTVDAKTPLVVGQLVLAKWQLMWETATITELKPDGQVAIQVLDAPFKSTLPRDRIQLPHTEYQNPEEIQRKLDLLTGTKAPVTRTWTDSSGQFKIEAQLLAVSGDTIKLKRTDGREIELPITKLSAEDQAFVKQSGKPANPFE